MSDDSSRSLLASANEPERCVISMCLRGLSACCTCLEKTIVGFTYLDLDWGTEWGTEERSQGPVAGVNIPSLTYTCPYSIREASTEMKPSREEQEPSTAHAEA